MKISLDSPFMLKADKAADVLAAGFLWLVFSVPVFTAGASSAAFYYAVVKSVRRNRETVGKAFFHSFKANLRQGTGLTAAYLLYGVMAAAYITQGEKVMQILKNPYCYWGVGIVFMLPLAFTLPYIFSVLSRFQTGILQQFFYAVHMSVKHFFSTVLLLFLLLGVCAGVYLLPFLLLVLPGIYVYFSSFLIERILKQYIKDTRENEELPWYLE